MVFDNELSTRCAMPIAMMTMMALAVVLIALLEQDAREHLDY